MSAHVGWLACLAIVALASTTRAQVQIEGETTLTGAIESVTPGVIVIKSAAGEAVTARIQERDGEGIALQGGLLVRFPAKVRVTGTQTVAALKPGQTLRFAARLNRLGRSSGEVAELWLVDGDDQGAPVKIREAAPKPDAFSEVEVIGTLVRRSGARMVVRVAENEFTRQTNLALNLGESAVVRFESEDYRRAVAGARVKNLRVANLSSGERLVKELEVEVTADSPLSTSADDQLALKYRQLSDAPVPPRRVRTTHFSLMTDISERQAAILLDKLETMAGLLTAYFGRGPRGPIEGFVVRDLSGWPPGLLAEPAGVAKIQEGAGICFSLSLGDERRSVVYSCDDHGVVQHEATHAFCNLAFGSAGPTWLAEGVAEMGNYWKQGALAVDISPIVISHLQNAPDKKRLREIAVPGRTDSGTWQDYAWRWALCHLLANNPNYADRFKPMAIALMEEQPNVSFEAVYGPVAREISFEYDQFLRTLDNGYRADLCAWPWNARSRPLQGDRRVQCAIKACAGWQASGVELVAGASYDVAAVGNWAIAKDGSQLDAEGDREGRGRLVGAVFHDYQLSEPFPIGKRLTFQPPAGGQLMLRCEDEWGRLEDNSGQLAVHLRLTPP